MSFKWCKSSCLVWLCINTHQEKREHETSVYWNSFRSLWLQCTLPSLESCRHSQERLGTVVWVSGGWEDLMAWAVGLVAHKHHVPGIRQDKTEPPHHAYIPARVICVIKVCLHAWPLESKHSVSYLLIVVGLLQAIIVIHRKWVWDHGILEKRDGTCQCGHVHHRVCGTSANSSTCPYTLWHILPRSDSIYRTPVKHFHELRQLNQNV